MANSLSSLSLPQGMEITAEIKPGYEAILTREALELVAALHRTFEPRRQELLRRASSARSGSTPASVPTSSPRRSAIRDGDWKIAPLPQALQLPPRRDHRPGRRARWSSTRFNSGADSYMTDFEDSNCAELGQPDPGPDQHLPGDPPHAFVRAAETARSYRLNDKIATLQVRPRGWHLDEKHVTVDGQRVLRRHLRLRAVHVPQREGAARARRRPVLLPAQDREPSRGAPVERHLRR